MSEEKVVIPLISLFHYSVLFTVPSRRPKKSLAATLTLQTLKQMLMTRVRRRRKTRMKRVGTGPRSRQRGGKGGRASLRFTSPVSWKVVTWRTKIMRSALRTCPRGSRCVCACQCLPSGLAMAGTGDICVFYLLVSLYRNSSRAFLQIGQKCPLWLKDERDKQVHCLLRMHDFEEFIFHLVTDLHANFAVLKWWHFIYKRSKVNYTIISQK